MSDGGPPRLHPATLRHAGGNARPGLAERPAVGIVHLGIGAFHRAHQAVYTAEAIERAGGGEAPRTAVGQLARGLALRAGRGEAGPLTVVSCDNLPRNGEVLGRLVRDFCARLPGRAGAPVLEWMERHVTFPSTMVDRVVPATTAADREEVARRLGLDDRAAVVAEPFRQWVIEDAFAGPRPAWDQAGALLVSDSGPHEAVKLRLLNGTHSLLAYVGGLAGARTVAGAWGDPAVAAAAERLGSEDLEPTLPVAPGIDIADYRAALGRRWINPRIAHRLEQIGADGSQKLPARFAAPARERLQAGAPPRWIALAFAAWARHLRASGDGLAVNDPGAEQVRRALAQASDHDAEAAAVLAALGEELAAPGPLRDLVADWLARIDADGIAGALQEAVRA